MPFATDEEIKTAHDVLLKGKPSFDEQRINIIKEDGSCYVQACPGSGKTTVLLTKLIILANRMPLPEGKGVCVLTHTNVAIDEIKTKLGQKADVLFRYPNFFGTIQTFLHKYVTAAALHFFYGSQITYVDDDVARVVLLKKYASLPWGKLKSFIYRRVTSRKHYISLEEVETLGGEELLTRLKIIKITGVRTRKFDFQVRGYNTVDIPIQYRSLVKQKRDSILKEEIMETLLKMHWDFENHCLKIDSMAISLQKDSAREYVSIKESMFKEGILSFDDAYSLAFRYIREKGLDFSAFSDKRFQYLFIDEVQDCDKQQVKLIKNIFAEDKVVIQRFGDYCQAIFSGDGAYETLNDELKSGGIRHIHNSNRFGEKIAKPLRTICLENNYLLEGNADVPSVKPIIITYENPLAVLPKYVDLLRTITIPEMGNISILDIAKREREQDPLKRINIKACGWVGKKGASAHKRFIESYFFPYERKNTKSKAESEFFNDFIINNTGTVKDYVASVIQGILKFLDLCDVKNGNKRYTRTAFIDFLLDKDVKKKHEFLNKVMGWTMQLVRSNGEETIRDVKDAIYQYLTETVLPLFGKSINENATAFFYVQEGIGQENLFNQQGNIFHNENNDIDVEVATVHAVKGETHISTLYLETFYFNGHDSERLSEQLKGIPYAGTDENTFKNLKVAYVAMSRPRYLLCVAFQKDRFDQIDSPELREIWDIVEA